MNLFYYTIYFSTLLIFLLFDIFFTFYSLTLSISISFILSIFCPSTYSLYLTIWLTFITGWILIKVGSYNLITLVNTILSMIYEPIYWFTNFFTGLSLNTKSLMLNIISSLFFYFLASFLSLSTCYFISSCTFLNIAPAFSYIFFILTTNSVTFYTFPFFLISALILNSHYSLL